MESFLKQAKLKTPSASRVSTKTAGPAPINTGKVRTYSVRRSTRGGCRRNTSWPTERFSPRPMCSSIVALLLVSDVSPPQTNTRPRDWLLNSQRRPQPQSISSDVRREGFVAMPLETWQPSSDCADLCHLVCQGHKVNRQLICTRKSDSPDAASFVFRRVAVRTIMVASVAVGKYSAGNMGTRLSPNIQI